MKTILIVEDDRFLANAYAIAFDDKKYTVLQAFDGVDAVKQISDKHPDLVILDLMLPLKDGFAVLTEIRANPATTNTKIIIASNLGQQSDIDRGNLLGANGYIVKSETSISDIIAKVESFL